MPDTLFQRPSPGSDADNARLHRRLARFNRRRLAPALPSDERDRNGEALRELEIAFLESSRAAVAPLAARAPTDPEPFIAWFENLDRTGPGQHDRLFPWLARAASREQMRWFLAQEMAGEAGFDDLVAMVQVKMPVRPKLELARNYWDEMGRGNAKGMHGPMLDALGDALALEPAVEKTVWEALALANTMVGLACSRSYAYHAIGALGVIELTAPGRAVLVAQGLKRLGVKGDARHYFDLHAVLDVKHSAAWNAEVIAPLVRDDPMVATAIAEGALMRLACGARCFDRYRRELGVS